MQVSGFYLTKKGDVITDEKVIEVLESQLKKLALASTVLTLTTVTTQAETNELMSAMEPAIKLIQNCSEPITYAYMALGFLHLTQGQEEKGKRTIKFAAMGYLGVKFVPQIMRMLDTIKLV